MSRRKLFSALFGSSLVFGSITSHAEDNGPARHMDLAAMHREFCSDHMAHKAGQLAYIAAKLNLAASQKPLWDSYYKAVMSSARSEEQLCLQSPIPSPDVHVTVLDHQSREVQMLQLRLQGMQSVQPVLASLYQSLSTEQRAVLDEHHHHGFGWHGMEEGKSGHRDDMGSHGFH